MRLQGHYSIEEEGLQKLVSKACQNGLSFIRRLLYSEFAFSKIGPY